MLGNALFGFAKTVVHTIPTSDNQGGNIDWLKAIFVAYLEVQTQFFQEFNNFEFGSEGRWSVRHQTQIF